MADAQVEYKRVDLQMRLLRNHFKYKFSFPSMYRRLKSTCNRSVTNERNSEARAGNAPGVKMAPRL